MTMRYAVLYYKEGRLGREFAELEDARKWARSEAIILKSMVDVVALVNGETRHLVTYDHAGDTFMVSL